MPRACSDAASEAAAQVVGWAADDARARSLAQHLCVCGFRPESPGGRREAAASYLDDAEGTMRLILGPEDADSDGPTLGDVRRYLRGVAAEFSAQLRGAEFSAPSATAAGSAAAAAGGGGAAGAAAASAAGGALTALPQPQAAPVTKNGKVVDGRYQMVNGSLVHNILRDQVAVICAEKLVWDAREVGRRGGVGGLVMGGVNGELTAEGKRHMEAVEQRLLSSNRVGWVRSFWPSLAGLGSEGKAAEEARIQLLLWTHNLMLRRAESRGTGEWMLDACVDHPAPGHRAYAL